LECLLWISYELAQDVGAEATGPGSGLIGRRNKGDMLGMGVVAEGGFNEAFSRRLVEANAINGYYSFSPLTFSGKGGDIHRERGLIAEKLYEWGGAWRDSLGNVQSGLYASAVEQA
jgi:hypothetical protein